MDNATFILFVLLGSGFLVAIYLIVRVAFRHEIEAIAQEEARLKDARK